MGGRQEGQEDIKCSLGGCHAWLMPCPLAGDSEGKLGGCSPHNHCPRSIDRRPPLPPPCAHCHKRPCPTCSLEKKGSNETAGTCAARVEVKLKAGMPCRLRRGRPAHLRLGRLHDTATGHGTKRPASYGGRGGGSKDGRAGRRRIIQNRY